MPVIKPNKNFVKVVSNVSIKFKDIFDMREFYNALHLWVEEYGWEAHKFDKKGNIKADGDKYEIYYREKITGGVKQLDIYWRMWRDSAQSKWLREHLDFKFQVIGLSNTEIIRDGQKLKVNKGEVEIVVDAWIEKLYIPAFEQHPFLKHFLKIFDSRVYEFQDKEKALYQEVYVLMNFMKQWFKLKRYLPYEETKSFFPSMSFPSHHKEDSGGH